jgi:hypothetical protein
VEAVAELAAAGPAAAAGAGAGAGACTAATGSGSGSGGVVAGAGCAADPVLHMRCCSISTATEQAASCAESMHVHNSMTSNQRHILMNPSFPSQNPIPQQPLPSPQPAPTTYFTPPQPTHSLTPPHPQSLCISPAGAFSSSGPGMAAQATCGRRAPPRARFIPTLFA